MLLKIYATGVPRGTQAGGLSLVVDADTRSPLPHQPIGQVWRYIATVSDDDAIFTGNGGAVAAALALRGFYASRRVFGVRTIHSHAPVERQQRSVDGRRMSGQRQLAERTFASA